MQPQHSPLEVTSWIATIVGTILTIMALFFSGIGTAFGSLLTFGLLIITISLIPWNLLFYKAIGRKQTLI